MKPQCLALFGVLLLILQLFTGGVDGMQAGGPQGGDGERALVEYRRPLFDGITLDDIVVEEDPYDKDNYTVFVAIQNNLQAWLIVGRHSSRNHIFFVRHCPITWVNGRSNRSILEYEKISEFYDQKKLDEENYPELRKVKNKLEEKVSLHSKSALMLPLKINRTSFSDAVIKVSRAFKYEASPPVCMKDDFDGKVKQRLMVRYDVGFLSKKLVEEKKVSNSNDILIKKIKKLISVYQDCTKTAGTKRF